VKALRAMQLLADSAADNESLVAEQQPNGSLACSIDVPEPDGSNTQFVVRIYSCGNEIKVRETAGRLPRFCPPRHINDDGTFCLGWPPMKMDHITDMVAAARWWTDLPKVFSRPCGGIFIAEPRVTAPVLAQFREAIAQRRCVVICELEEIFVLLQRDDGSVAKLLRKKINHATLKKEPFLKVEAAT